MNDVSLTVSNPGDISRQLEPIEEDEDELKQALLPDYERRRSTAKFALGRIYHNSKDQPRNKADLNRSSEIIPLDHTETAHFNTKLQRTVSESAKEAEDIGLERRETFRPPFDPRRSKFEKNRTDAENFTFSRKETFSQPKNLRSQENPFRGLTLNFQKDDEF